MKFDIDADGYQETLSWTPRFSEIAFLALDRNGNGTIDDGAELFGNFTDQLPSPEPNGFEALDLLDSSGDGKIDSGDESYDALLLWTDEDHDGYSDPHELAALSDEIQSLELQYRSSLRQDEHGNLLRFWSMAHRNDGTNIHTVDVFFVYAD